MIEMIEIFVGISVERFVETLDVIEIFVELFVGLFVQIIDMIETIVTIYFSDKHYSFSNNNKYNFIFSTLI